MSENRPAWSTSLASRSFPSLLSSASLTRTRVTGTLRPHPHAAQRVLPRPPRGHGSAAPARSAGGRRVVGLPWAVCAHAPPGPRRVYASGRVPGRDMPEPHGQLRSNSSQRPPGVRTVVRARPRRAGARVLLRPRPKAGKLPVFLGLSCKRSHVSGPFRGPGEGTLPLPCCTASRPRLRQCPRESAPAECQGGSAVRPPPPAQHREPLLGLGPRRCGRRRSAHVCGPRR